MHAPRAIVFDLDGTLIDSRGDIVAAVNHALIASGRDALPASTIVRFIGDGARALLSRTARVGEDAAPELDALVASYTAYYPAHPLEFTRWVEGAREALEEIRSQGALRVALCTNKPRAITTEVLRALDAERTFDATWAGGDGPEKKPSPGPLLRLAEALALPASDLVMVGDGPQDVLAGRAAKCRTVALLSGYGSPSELRLAGPDVAIASMSELAGILRRWSTPTKRTSDERR
ncbi:MAG: HAD hydrolase-like protein [Polyangiaceae bacterium]